MAQLQHHHSGSGGAPNSTGYMGFDSSLQTITSLDIGADPLDQCYNDRSPREKRQRLSPSSHQDFRTPDTLTTLRDTLSADVAVGRMIVPGSSDMDGGGGDIGQIHGSSLSASHSQGNEQGLNEVLQRFASSPILPQAQSSLTVKTLTPFDCLSLPSFATGSPPQFENSLVLHTAETDRSQSKFLDEGVWSPNIIGLNTLSAKSCVATHDASTMEQLLVQCAQALESNDVSVAQQMMFILSSIAPAEGDPNQRVTACFLKALIRRAAKMLPAFSTMATVGKTSKVKSAVEYAGMIDLTPWYRFGFKAANGVMMEAFEGKDKVHIIDFTTTYGMQWPTLIESLSERAEGPPHVRLTIHEDRPNVPPYLGMSEEEIANKLIQFASNRNVDLEISIVHFGIHQLDHSMFDIRKDEVTVVNCMYRTRFVPDESADPPNCLRDSFLRFIHNLDPALVILVDEEATLTSPHIVTRLKAAFNYIWIPFDALDTFLPRDSSQRMEYELDLEKKIENIVAREGLHRIERLETKDKWGQRMRRVGFKFVTFSDDVTSDMKSMLNDHAAGWGMKHDDDSLLLTWKGHNVLFATAWQPMSFHT